MMLQRAEHCDCSWYCDGKQGIHGARHALVRGSTPTWTAEAKGRTHAPACLLRYPMHGREPFSFCLEVSFLFLLFFRPPRATLLLASSCHTPLP
jgi:hypothetical protein